MPTIQQLAASNDPNDQAALLALLGNDPVAVHQANNQYGVGGTGYKPWLTSLASQHLTDPTAAMASGWANEGLGSIGPDGKWVWADGKGWDPSGGDVSTGWSNVNAQGGFTGGTGVGLGSNMQPIGGGPAPKNPGGGGGADLRDPTAGMGVGSNMQSAQQILGGYWKTKPDGSPDYAAMGTTAFFNTLPANVRIAYANAKLGASFQQIAGTDINGKPIGGAPAAGGTPGATPPKAGTPATGTPAAPGASTTLTEDVGLPVSKPYVDPTRPEDTTSPFDFLDDAGYQFRKKQGMEGIQSSAAAGGGLMSGATLKALEDFNSGLASSEYDKAYSKYDLNRKFKEGQFQTDRTSGRANYEADRGFDESGRRWTLQFNKDTGQWEKTFDRDTATSDRNFNETQRLNDQNFNYQAATGDRAFNQQSLKDLSTLMLQAVNGDNSAAAALAAIIGANTNTAGQAGASGAAVDNAAWQQILNQIINSIGKQKVVTAGGG